MVTSRALLVPFHDTFANSARLEKACFHKIWGKYTTTKLGISLDSTRDLTKAALPHSFLWLFLASQRALSPETHFSVGPWRSSIRHQSMNRLN